MRIYVRLEDIKNATFGCGGRKCPVARALRRITGLTASVGYGGIKLGKVSLPAPTEKTRQFMRAFDNELGVLPCHLTIRGI